MRSSVVLLRVWLVFFLAFQIPLLSFAGDGESDSAELAAQSARFYRSPEERREAGQGTELTDWLLFAGLVEIEQEYLENHFQNDIETTEADGATPTIEAVLEVTFLPWLIGEFVFEPRSRPRSFDPMPRGIDDW